MTALLLATALFFRPVPPPAHFQLVVTPAPHGYEMSCSSGCAWKTLSFGCEANCRVGINDRGVYSDPDNAAERASNFAFEFHRTLNGWELTSRSGTGWRSLSWGCGIFSCNALVDETGVRSASWF